MAEKSKNELKVCVFVFVCGCRCSTNSLESSCGILCGIFRPQSAESDDELCFFLFFAALFLCRICRKALLLLKKKRYQDQLLDKTENQVSNLELMVGSIIFDQGNT